MPNSMNKFRYILYVLLTIGIAFYITYPLLTGTYNYPLGEYEIYKSFMVNFIETLKKGELPVWNEYVGGGHPAMYFGHYPITQNTFLYMLFGVNDSTYYFVRFLSLIILLASFVYAGRLLKFGYLTSLIGSLVYFSINFISRWLMADTIGNLVLVYPLLVVLIFRIIKDEQWKTILIFNLVYIFWLIGGHITYVYTNLIMLSVIYWVSVFTMDTRPLRPSNLRRRISLYFILFIIPVVAVLYQYYFVYDIIKVSNKFKEGLIASPFETIVWEQLLRSFKNSSYFWVGLILVAISSIRKSVRILNSIYIAAAILLLYSIIADIQFASVPIFLVDYIPISNSSDFRWALLLYFGLPYLIFKRSRFVVRIDEFVICISLLSYYFYSPDNISGMDHDLFLELSSFVRIFFVLCIFFSMKSYRNNKMVKILAISLIVLYLIRSHLTIPLMRFAGIVWYPTRDSVAFSAAFAFLFLFGLRNLGIFFLNALKNKSVKVGHYEAVYHIKYVILLTLLAVLVQDSYHKFYDGQCNKVVFPNRMNLVNTEREGKALNNRKEILSLNSQLLALDKRTDYFYRIFTPEPVFTYLAGDLQSHKIHDAAIYESSMSKDYRDFFDYVILKKPLLDSKEIKNVLPHAVFTKHIYPGLNVSQGQISYNDVFLFSAVDAPYLKNQNIEFFWDIMQVKYLVVGSAFSKALEGFSDKENYKLLGYYPSLDLNLYEITKNKKYSKFGILPLGDNEDFDKVMERLNSGDVDVLKDVYARVIYLDKDTKDFTPLEKVADRKVSSANIITDSSLSQTVNGQQSLSGFTLLKNQTEQSRRYYEIDAEQKGILIEFESWNTHWGLTVNKDKKDLYKAFRIFRGIKIEPGRNVIELRYKVQYFKELFWLSVGALCIYGIFLIKVLLDDTANKKSLL